MHSSLCEMLFRCLKQVAVALSTTGFFLALQLLAEELEVGVPSSKPTGQPGVQVLHIIREQGKGSPGPLLPAAR